ncbi:hypothetical protein CR513_50713, partial [Mucuna pruriens]
MLHFVFPLLLSFEKWALNPFISSLSNHLDSLQRFVAFEFVCDAAHPHLRFFFPSFRRLQWLMHPEEESLSSVPELDGPLYVDGKVQEVSSVYTKAHLLDGLIHHARLPRPWLIRLLPYQPDACVCDGLDGEELYTYLYDTLSLRLGIRTKAHAASVRVERAWLKPWEEKFLAELISHPTSSYSVLKTGLDVATRKALRKQE